MPRHLRSVGDDGDPPEKDGDLAVVIEDLEIAHGHVIEATAEARELAGPAEPVVELVDTLIVADAAVTKALLAAHKAKP